MLNEAILKFKGLAPLILPELVNNNQLEEVSMYEDYAILPYSVQKPLPLEEVMHPSHRPYVPHTQYRNEE